MLQIFFIFALTLIYEIQPFQLNMIVPLPRIARPPALFPLPTDIPKFMMGSNNKGGITSSLISTLAIAALERRLGDDATVDCVVQAEPTDLIRGRVGPVVVKGNKWRSPLGMSCRALEAKVGSCLLDLTSVLQKQKLILTVPARGSAVVTFNAKDFGNFLTHPLLQAPQYRYKGEIQNLKFSKDAVLIDPNTSSVSFYMRFLDSNWRCTLTRSRSYGAIVQVLPTMNNNNSNNISGEEIHKISSEISNTLTRYFNELVFELQGTFVSFKDMNIPTRPVTNRSCSPEVLLELDILVKKFPSRKLNF